MKVVGKQFRSFMWGTSRQAFEENMLGDKKILGDNVQLVEGGFTVVSISVEYIQLVFGLGFYVFKIPFPL